MGKKKFYVVWKGLKPGIYESWDDCQAQIKGFTGAIYKSFPLKELALEAYNKSYENFMGKNTHGNTLSSEEKALLGNPIPDSISVDASCSGNPGRLEYQGADTKSSIILFRKGPYEEGTQNIGEFLAIVHGLAYLAKQQSTIPVYSDSKTAIKWVKEKAVKTKLPRTSKNKALFDLVDRAVLWLKQHDYPNRILKWETAAWGEIPADFGRK
ncbi:viroplasmin family protein [candidate division KSB1 bacterium]